MRMFAHLGAVLTAALLIAGCAAGPGGGIDAYFADATPIAKQGERKTIGVISAIGDTFEVKTVGITVFGNNLESAPLAAARLDEHAIASVGKTLGPTVTLKTIAVPAGAFDRAYRPPGALSGAPDASKTVYERYYDVLKQHAPQHKADGYLMILKSSTQFANTNQSMLGVGVVRGSDIFGANSYLHAVLEFRYYDANLDLKNVKHTRIQRNPFMPHPVSAPNVPFDPSWPKTVQELAADKRVHEAARKLIDEGIASTLPQAVTIGPVKKQKAGS